MLNTIPAADFRWSRLQEPARPSNKPADLLRLLSALDSGWKILDPVRVFTCRDLYGGQVFAIDLCHPVTGELRELLLARQESVERCLREEKIAILG